MVIYSQMVIYINFFIPNCNSQCVPGSNKYIVCIPGTCKAKGFFFVIVVVLLLLLWIFTCIIYTICLI